MDKLICVEDFQKAACEILDRNAREYYLSGADDEVTLRENKVAFQRYILRPRMLRNVSVRSLETTVFGKLVAFPLGVSPTAMQKLAHPDGEVANAKAAAAMGTIYTLPTMGTSTIEEVAAATPNSRKWFQLYIYKDRNLTEKLIRRAERAGFEALVLTVDSFLFGKKRVPLRENFKMPPHLRMANFDISANVKGAINDYVADSLDQGITWKDVHWVKNVSRLKIVVKGILTPEDAMISLQYGVDGIFISNHGGRQLDTVQTTAEVLPEIAAAVKGRCEIFVDCGVSRGSDIFKALALGAKMAFAGRPLIWGLAAGGEEGAKKVLQIYRDELDLTMALAGVSKISEITEEYVMRRSVL